MPQGFPCGAVAFPRLLLVQLIEVGITSIAQLLAVCRASAWAEALGLS
jgi:hypothetical protein